VGTPTIGVDYLQSVRTQVFTRISMLGLSMIDLRVEPSCNNSHNHNYTRSDTEYHVTSNFVSQFETTRKNNIVSANMQKPDDTVIIIHVLFFVSAQIMYLSHCVLMWEIRQAKKSRSKST